MPFAVRTEEQAVEVIALRSCHSSLLQNCPRLLLKTNMFVSHLLSGQIHQEDARQDHQQVLEGIPSRPALRRRRRGRGRCRRRRLWCWPGERDAARRWREGTPPCSTPAANSASPAEAHSPGEADALVLS